MLAIVPILAKDGATVAGRLDTLPGTVQLEMLIAALAEPVKKQKASRPPGVQHQPGRQAPRMPYAGVKIFIKLPNSTVNHSNGLGVCVLLQVAGKWPTVFASNVDKVIMKWLRADQSPNGKRSKRLKGKLISPNAPSASLQRMTRSIATRLNDGNLMPLSEIFGKLTFFSNYLVTLSH